MSVLSKANLLTDLAAHIRSSGAGGLTTAADTRQFLIDFIDSIYDETDSFIITASGWDTQNVKITTNQLINGLKTFTTLPQSSAAPSTGTDLTNKTYVDGLIATLTALVSSAVPFDSSAAIKRQVPNLEGIVLGKTTMADTMQELLYGVKFPLISLGVNSREFGNPVANIAYTATKTDTAITNIIINGTAVTVIAPGNTQSGSSAATAGTSADSTFNVQVIAGKTANQSIISKVSNAVYFGYLNKSGLTGQLITDSDISTLTGRLISVANDRQISQIVTLPSLQYLVIGFNQTGPAPVFKINGIANNDFIKVRSGNFVNSFSYTYSNFDVWVSVNKIVGTLQLDVL